MNLVTRLFVNHTVNHVGYGVDEVTGEKYDDIRNSWEQVSGKNCEILFVYWKLRVVKFISLQ